MISDISNGKPKDEKRINLQLELLVGSVIISLGSQLLLNNIT